MDVREYVGVLRHGIAILVIGVLLGALAGFGLASSKDPVYAATSKNLVSSSSDGDLADWVQVNQIAGARISSYLLVATSGLVLQPVIDELGLSDSVDELASRVSATNPAGSTIVEITATAPTPDEAAAIANAVSTHFAEVVADQLEVIIPASTATPAPASPSPAPTPEATATPEDTDVLTVVRIVNLEQAVVPSAPLDRNIALYALVGGVLGLAAGLGVVSLRQALDTRIRSPRDIAGVTKVPVIGEIPSTRETRGGALVAYAGSTTPVAEAFRGLRAHVEHLRATTGARVLVVTAVRGRQGSTTVTANLGLALANAGVSVALVDADLRARALSGTFGLAGQPGLSDVLAGRVVAEAVLRQPGGPVVLPAGLPTDTPGELLAGPRMRELLADLRAAFDIVLVDSPSIGELSDAAVLGAGSDATLLVTAAGGSRRDGLIAALAALDSGGAAPVGLVLTRGARGGATPRAVGETAPRPRAPRPSASSAASRPTLGTRLPHDPVPWPFGPAAAAQPGGVVASPEPIASAVPAAEVTAPATGAPEGAEPIAAAVYVIDEPDGARVPPGVAPVAVEPVAASPAPVVAGPTLAAPTPTVAPVRSLFDGAKPTPTADELRDGALPAVPPVAPVPTPTVRPSRFAPDPSRFAPGLSALLGGAPRKTPPPPIDHILPAAERGTEPQATPAQEAGPVVPSPALTAPAPEPAPLRLVRESELAHDSSPLLDEIGGVPVVEVRHPTTPRPADDRARQNYERRARELERAAQDRLKREQARVEKLIREELESGRRDLESVLNNRIEDTITLGR